MFTAEQKADLTARLLAVKEPRTRPIPRKRSNKAVTFSIHERGSEWRVMHGNKIIGRHATHEAADAQLTQCLGRKAPAP